MTGQAHRGYRDWHRAGSRSSRRSISLA